jgi:Helix-turn-helix domain
MVPRSATLPLRVRTDAVRRRARSRPPLRAVWEGAATVSEILTADQLAERWQVTPQWIYAKTRAGDLPKIPLPGRYYRYRLDVIERFERGELESTNGSA